MVDKNEFENIDCDELADEISWEEQQELIQEQREAEKDQWISDNEHRLKMDFLGKKEITISDALDVDEFFSQHSDEFTAFCDEEFKSES